jgi:hypothetical protein
MSLTEGLSDGPSSEEGERWSTAAGYRPSEAERLRRRRTGSPGTPRSRKLKQPPKSSVLEQFRYKLEPIPPEPQEIPEQRPSWLAPRPVVEGEKKVREALGAPPPSPVKFVPPDIKDDPAGWFRALIEAQRPVNTTRAKVLREEYGIEAVYVKQRIMDPQTARILLKSGLLVLSFIPATSLAADALLLLLALDEGHTGDALFLAAIAWSENLGAGSPSRWRSGQGGSHDRARLSQGGRHHRLLPKHREGAIGRSPNRGHQDAAGTNQ